MASLQDFLMLHRKNPTEAIRRASDIGKMQTMVMDKGNSCSTLDSFPGGKTVGSGVVTEVVD